jgi:hypothetical protein
MQIITNEKKVARGARVGKIGTLVGLGFLTAGLILSLTLGQNAALIWISFLCLLLGLVASSIGTMNMNRWLKQPRADQALAQGLKGFDDKHRLYNYWLPAPHVLLRPTGLYVLTAMGQDGAISYDGTRFQRKFSASRLVRFMAEEGLGRPFAQADAQVQDLRLFIEKNGVDGDLDIQNVLVFYNPRAELTVSETPRPVVTTKGLKKALTRQPTQKLSTDLYQKLQALFDATVQQQS